MGHVRDLPKREMGVSIDDRSFKPKYVIPPDKRKIISELKAESAKAGTVYLATDPDREGEAISWHLIEAAKIDPAKTKRVAFHEITEKAVQEAFDHPRDLDTHLIDAQQARRVLDRLVGYDLSPLLWRKVRRGLSAGRVQSVALRIVVDREREIDAFVPEEYWSIEADLAKRPQNGKKNHFTAALHAIEGRPGKLKIANGDEAGSITSDLDGAEYAVGTVKKRQRKSRPAAPFITSTLQQEAWGKLRFTARRTMIVAQQLYEGIELGDEGSSGLITYMRTDSTNVAASALDEARGYINEHYGRDYLPDRARSYTKKVKGAQEAHEAIRPTSILREPKAVKEFLSREQLRLYELIWKRMLASQMTDALFDATTVDIAVSGMKTGTAYTFRATGSVMRFPGFRTLYTEDKDESAGASDDSKTLPELEKGNLLDLIKLASEQHFTQPPPRYTEASLVRALEENGIGRPSTYAAIVVTILDRDYVRKDGGRFVPTKLGMVVTDLLTTHFPDIMDVGFTARVEEELDDIASGEREWTPVLQEFYDPFTEAVETAMEKAERIPRDQIDEESDEVCEECGKPMVIKSGKYGRFLACTGFPECRNTKPLLERIGVQCPEDGGDIVERQGRGRNKKFYGCANYPDCTFSSSTRPLPQPCPECGELLVASGRSNAKCTKCKFKGPVPEEEEALEVAV